MKTKGFTLVELLAVIVILGLIGLIAIPTVTSSLNSYKKKLKITQENNIKSAAKSWMAKNIEKTPNGDSGVCNFGSSCSEDYETLVITLKELQNSKLIDDDLKDPETNKKIDANDYKVCINSEGNKLVYFIGDDCKGLLET